MFFSIVIPTRNRANLLKSAIDSVLNQDFTDFELIISDNSSKKSSEEVQEILRRYDDKRITFIRPPSELPMSDHWDWALRHTSGEYVSVLYDRAVYKKSALSRIHREINNHDFPEAVTFSRDSLIGEDPPYHLVQQRHTDKVFWCKSEDVLDKLSKAVRPEFWPLLSNSFNKCSLQKKMRDTFGTVCGGAFDPTNYFCFQALDLIDRYLCIDNSLIIMHGEKYSNGKYNLMGKESETTKDYFNFVKNQDVLKYAPISMAGEFIPLPLNYIYNEYNMVMSRQTSGRFKEIDNVKLYTAIMNHLGSAWEISPHILNKCLETMEKFRKQKNIPVYYLLEQKAKKMMVKIKNAVKPVARPLIYFISEKFNIGLFGVDSYGMPKGAFSTVEDALEYDRNHSVNHS
jgi:glycosyltransferase involved in cell wall biosynthesis